MTRAVDQRKQLTDGYAGFKGEDTQALRVMRFERLGQRKLNESRGGANAI